MIKVSDFVAKFVAEHKDTAKSIFLVSGGGMMHILDSIGKEKRLEYVCNHHEQACSIAAEGFARVTNKIGVCAVTTGPGGTNAVSGVMGAWVDSIPMLVISGQVKLETTIYDQPNLRQLGDQEINIVDIVKPITKYAVMITDKNEIKYHLQKALYEAKNGRPGPVWIDVPLDIQGAQIYEKDLKEFIPPKEPQYDCKTKQVLELLKVSKRPVIIAGNGITLAGANKEFLELVEKLKIPVISTFARYDILKNDSLCSFGRYGTLGNRYANFIVQNSDLIIAIGARMNVRAVSYNWDFFAREAKRVVVDIDSEELKKRTAKIDLPVIADAKEFIEEFIKTIQNNSIPTHNEWLERCKKYKNDFPTIEKERQKVKDFVDSYNFFDVMSDVAKDDAVFVFGNGTACVSSYQSLRLKKNQKVVVNSGCASMGYDLPAAIGACYGNDKKEVMCVTGDGSIQMNIQELQTIIHNNLPIKIFILNNDGYVSIKNTQNGFFKGHMVGSGRDSGVSFPDIKKLSFAYGYKYFKLENQKNLKKNLKKILETDGHLICEVMLNPKEKMEPKLSSEAKPDGRIVSKPLEDMYPFLDRDIFKKNMIVKPIDE